MSVQASAATCHAWSALGEAEVLSVGTVNLFAGRDAAPFGIDLGVVPN